MEVVKCGKKMGLLYQLHFRGISRYFSHQTKRDVPEMTFTHRAAVSTKQNRLSLHDKPELIQIVSGHGIAICDGVETQIGPDMALYVRAGEMHQVINTGDESLKLATVFVPGFPATENFKRCLDAAK